MYVGKRQVNGNRRLEIRSSLTEATRDLAKSCMKRTGIKRGPYGVVHFIVCSISRMGRRSIVRLHLGQV